MELINNIEQLMDLPGENIGFFGGSFNPPHFGHLNFIKKAASIKNLDHIILCPTSNNAEHSLEELKHRMRIMDLIMETSKSSGIFVLSPEVCDGVQNKIFIDDIFYLLKRRKKNIYVLIGCDDLAECSNFFKSIDVIFIIGCRIKRSDIEKELLSKKLNCVFIDDIIPCSAEDLKNDISKRKIYLSEEIREYMNKNELYWFNKECGNCN